MPISLSIKNSTISVIALDLSARPKRREFWFNMQWATMAIFLLLLSFNMLFASVLQKKASVGASL
jgi:uncharacterized membrane protein YhaH (DUF805 family)